MGIGSEATADGSPAAGSASLWRSVLMQRVQDELGAAAVTGLSNEAGEFNCFLNVVIQCLWRCADFRRQASLAGRAAAWCGVGSAALTCLSSAAVQVGDALWVVRRQQTLSCT
jgi:hypothetical protein